MKEKKEYQFNSSMSLKTIIALHKHTLEEIKKTVPSHRVIELYENTLAYLNLLDEVMNDHEVIDLNSN